MGGGERGLGTPPPDSGSGREANAPSAAPSQGPAAGGPPLTPQEPGPQRRPCLDLCGRQRPLQPAVALRASSRGLFSSAGLL